MRDAFTDDAMHAISAARKEAFALNANVIRPEHVLLGIAAVDRGPTAEVFRYLMLDAEALRYRIYHLIKRGSRARSHDGDSHDCDLTFSSSTKALLDQAAAIATSLRHPYTGTEHLLLALMQQPRELAARVLGHAGVRVEAITEATRRLHGSVPAD